MVCLAILGAKHSNSVVAHDDLKNLAKPKARIGNYSDIVSIIVRSIEHPINIEFQNFNHVYDRTGATFLEVISENAKFRFC